MNQIKRIIHSTLGKTLVLCAFALSTLVTASVVIDSRASGFAEGRNGYGIASSNLGLRGHGFVWNVNGVFNTIDAPGATYFTVAFGIDGNGRTVGGYVDGSGRLHGFKGGFVLDQDGFLVIDYPGAQATFAARMNNQGQIVGAYSNEPNTPAFNLPHGFLREADGVFKSIDFPGARRTQPFGINNLGQIVGEYVDQNGRSHGFLWNNGVFTTIDAPGPVGTSTIAFDINDSGQIVGIPFTGSISAGPCPAGSCPGFLRNANGVFTEVKIPGALRVFPYGINNLGRIVGDYVDKEGKARGFLLGQGGVVNIAVRDAKGITLVHDINDGGQLAGAYDILAHGYLKDTSGNFTIIDHPDTKSLTGETIGINNFGHIVGSYVDATTGTLRGFLRDERGFTPIDFPDALETLPTKINENGQVVGNYVDADQNVHGFLFNNGAFTKIDATSDVPGLRVILTAALDIDNQGQIVGQYQDETGRVHGFLRNSSGAFTTIDVTIDNAIGTSINGINDQGQMTGVYLNNRGLHGFLRDQEIVKTIDFPGAVETQAYSINNSGQIVGAYIEGGRFHEFLWVNGTSTRLTKPPGALQDSGAFDIDDLGRIVGRYY
jgi:probable HAF family extracellular repeat protein